MKNEIHHIDEYFLEGLAHIEVEPPADVWDNIEKELDRKRRIRIIKIWTGMAASLALFVSLGIYVLNNNSQSAQDKQNTHYTSTESPKNIQATNTTSKTNAKIKQQYTIANVTDPIQTQHNTDKVNNTTSVSIDKNRRDDIQNLKGQNSDNGFQEVIVLSTDKTSDVNELYTNESDYIVADNLQADTNLQVLPLVVNNSTHIGDNQPSNKNLVSVIEVANPLMEYGNKNDYEKAKMNTWSLEGQLAPQYSYTNHTENPNSDNESGLVAYGGGFKVSYQSSKRLSFQAGVYYSVMGETWNKVYEVKQIAAANAYAANSQKNFMVYNSSLGPIITENQPDPNSQNNTIVSTTRYSSFVVSNPDNDFLKAVSTSQSTYLDDAQIIQQLKYIEVPFTARYKLINKRMGCHLLAGLSTNILINNDIYLKQNGSKESIGKTGYLKKLNYSSVVGVGIDYQWLKNISISIEPTYKYFLNSASEIESIKTHPYSFGLFTGLTYRF